MSSVLVRGMKMPKSCFGCHLFNLDDQDLWCIANHYAGYCRELSKYIDEDKFVNERHPDCPLIEVPTPHGRLIDIKSVEDGKFHAVGNDYQRWWNGALESVIDNAPTVIEAEE